MSIDHDNDDDNAATADNYDIYADGLSNGDFQTVNETQQPPPRPTDFVGKISLTYCAEGAEAAGQTKHGQWNLQGGFEGKEGEGTL